MARGRRARRAGSLAAAALAGALALGTAPAGAQELADFDWEHLSFRGIGLEVGHMQPSRVESTESYSLRADLGYLGPGVRVVGGLSYWSSVLRRSEVRRLEERVLELIETDGEDVTVDLGEVTWSDVALTVDAHMVWSVGGVFLTYGGLGAGAHVMSGGGAAVEGTFVEDLLDSVRPSVNVHAGVELPVRRWFRIYGVSRFEVMENLNYFDFRLGGQVHWGGSVEGEEPR